MSPDDERHGTQRGYRLHLEEGETACQTCADAWYRYGKRTALLRIAGTPLRVPALGTQRRIRALQALGYGLPYLATELGIATGNLSYKMQQPYMARRTHEAVAALYDRLCMAPPPHGWIAERTRNIARKRGWPAPLAWDDIDTDAEPPTALYEGDGVDVVVVMRLLEGQRVKATKAEKEAAMEQWVADGGSRRELASWHGWKAERYTAGLRLVKGGAA